MDAVIVVVLLSACIPFCSADPIVDTTSGKILGTSVAWADTEVDQFLGVPYAMHDRFGKPFKYPSWTGIRHATEYGASCPQQAGEYIRSFLY